MPSTKNALSRYYTIDEILCNRHIAPPGKKELLRLVERKLGVRISERTLAQDISDMRECEELGYFAPIVYDRQRGGYVYEDEHYSIRGLKIQDEHLNILMVAIQQLSGMPNLKELQQPLEQLRRVVMVGSKTGKFEYPDVVQMEHHPDASGMEHFETLFNAILNKNKLRFRYQKFGKEESAPYTIRPYLLREYKNRWYLVARREDNNLVRIYGLDRITYCHELSRDTFKEDFNADQYFRYALGITVVDDAVPVQIELLFSKEDAHYILSNKIHHSQEVISHDELGLHISIILHPSYELNMLIRGYGPGVRVLKPDWLAERIRLDALETAARYNS
ncbi:MAG: WYL domain-containing protein [Bacteroidetes bacterium]|nr:WYL domain-containing protein [Bacteroidota bacterium]